MVESASRADRHWRMNTGKQGSDNNRDGTGETSQGTFPSTNSNEKCSRINSSREGGTKRRGGAAEDLRKQTESWETQTSSNYSRHANGYWRTFGVHQLEILWNWVGESTLNSYLFVFSDHWNGSIYVVVEGKVWVAAGSTVQEDSRFGTNFRLIDAVTKGLAFD